MSNDGFGLFFCGRPNRSLGCQEPNCTRAHVVTCTFELQGRRAGEACGRRLCTQHAAGLKAPVPLPMCSPHARLEQARRSGKAAI